MIVFLFLEEILDNIIKTKVQNSSNLNNNEFSNGVYSQGSIRADAGFKVSGTTVIDSNGSIAAGLVSVTVSAASTADTVDSLHASSFIRSDADDTSSGVLSLSKDTTDVVNFSASSSNNNRGICKSMQSRMSESTPTSV